MTRTIGNGHRLCSESNCTPPVLRPSMRKTILVGLAIAGAVVLAPGVANALPFNDGACFTVMDQPLPCANVRGRVFVSGNHVYVFPVCVYIGDVTQCPVGFTDVPLPAALPFYGPNQDCYIYFYEGGVFDGYYLVCQPSWPGFFLPAPIPQRLPPLPPLPLP